MQLKLILLDFDGTLADTRQANTAAYVAALREAGYDLTTETYEACYFGMRCEEFLTNFGIADPSEREQLRLRKIALYPSYFGTVRLNVPLWEFCRQFRASGGKVWIVSTGSRANIENVMRHLGIGCMPDGEGDGLSGKAPDGRTACNERGTRSIAPDNSAADGSVQERGRKPSSGTATDRVRIADDLTAPFANGCVDGIISGADVEQAKPAPDCFLEAMRREGCTPGETLIFEDSPIGLEAARRSGACYVKVAL